MKLTSSGSPKAVILQRYSRFAQVVRSRHSEATAQLFMPGNTRGRSVAGRERQRRVFFRRAKQLAERYLREPQRLKRLVSRAADKARGAKGPLAPVGEPFASSLRMIRAYAQGRYTMVPWNTLVAVVAAVIYFLMPFDAVPDFILGLGLLDDLAVISWVLKTFQSDIKAFEDWEAESR